MSGNLSNALLWAQIAIAEQSDDALDKCFSVLHKNMDSVQQQSLTYKLSIGVTGLAWTMQMLQNNKMLSAKDCEDLQSLDAYIIKTLEWNKVDVVYDLLQGIIGKGLYLIERNNELTREALSGIVDFLESTAIRISENSIAWPDYHTSYFDHTERDGLGYYNMGLAHGIPSIIVFLSRLYQLDIKKEICTALIQESVRFLLENERISDPVFQFPVKIYPRSKTFYTKPNDGKIGWCYGPLSIAVALLSAYQITGQQNYYQKAYAIVLKTKNVKIPTILAASGSKTIDPYLCHGTSGLAYLYHKFANCFVDNELRTVSNYWLSETYQLLATTPRSNLKTCGILDGLTGTGLILNDLEANGKINFQWDQLFLLNDIPMAN